MKKPILSVICTMMMGFSFFSAKAEVAEAIPVTDTIFLVLPESELVKADSLLSKPLIKNENKRKKLVAGVLALPFPFGFIGAHRVMLGCKPWVPVVYIATIGGCFGLLPLIDFCVIMFSKDIEQYENNPHIFMWVK